MFSLSPVCMLSWSLSLSLCVCLFPFSPICVSGVLELCLLCVCVFCLLSRFPQWGGGCVTQVLSVCCLSGTIYHLVILIIYIVILLFLKMFYHVKVFFGGFSFLFFFRPRNMSHYCSLRCSNFCFKWDFCLAVATVAPKWRDKGKT